MTQKSIEAKDSARLARVKISDWLSFKGMSQAQLARLSGVNQGSISQFLNNKSSIALESLDRIASVMSCSTSEVLADGPSRPLNQWYLAEDVGRNLRRILLEKNWSWFDLADGLEISANEAEQLVRGKGTITPQLIAELSPLLDRDETQFFKPDLPPSLSKANLENSENTDLSDRDTIPPELLAAFETATLEQRNLMIQAALEVLDLSDDGHLDDALAGALSESDRLLAKLQQGDLQHKSKLKRRS